LVTRAQTLLRLCLALALFACVGEPAVVRLDLCSPSAATAGDLALLDGVAAWNISVLGLDGDDVAWRRSFGGSEQLQVDVVELTSAVPAGSDVRLIVEGYGLDENNQERLVAVAGSDRLTLNGGERVCLCVAPPEHYATLCVTRTCSFDYGQEICQGP
jgi:hypothetical protein